jgi:hypothetical protein
MHKNATNYNKTQSKWCKNKHGASKIIDTFETYHANMGSLQGKKKEALFKGKPDALLHLLRRSYHRSWSAMKQKARMHQIWPGSGYPLRAFH